jgi:hypothetical protein
MYYVESLLYDLARTNLTAPDDDLDAMPTSALWDEVRARDPDTILPPTNRRKLITAIRYMR